MIEERKFAFGTFPWWIEKGKLVGLLSGPWSSPRYAKRQGRRCPHAARARSVHPPERTGQRIRLPRRQIFTEHLGIHKLLVVDEKDKLRGLFTMERHWSASRRNAARIQARAGRELSLWSGGAAVSATRMPWRTRTRERILTTSAGWWKRGGGCDCRFHRPRLQQGRGDTVRVLRGAFPKLPAHRRKHHQRGGRGISRGLAAANPSGRPGSGSICTTDRCGRRHSANDRALCLFARSGKEKSGRFWPDGGITKSATL